MYSTLIIAYLFLGGAAGGAFLVMAAWSLAFHRRSLARSDRLRTAFRALRAVVYPAATVMLAVSMVCLWWDLEMPDRALLIFLIPRPTVLTFGAAVLTVELTLGLLLTLANLFHSRLLNGRVKRVLEIACCICSVAVMAYTGFFLMSNIGVPLWRTATLVGLFFFSAASSGISTVLLIDYFVQGQTYLLRATRPLQRLHLACLGLEAAFLAAFVVAAATHPAAASAFALLTSPEMLPTGILGVIGLGIVLPFTLELYALLKKDCRMIPVSDFVCLIGAFCLRWIVIVCGVH